MKIFAIGMNYAEHNKAMNETLLQQEEPPVIFTKADSSLISNHKPFFIHFVFPPLHCTKIS